MGRRERWCIETGKKGEGNEGVGKTRKTLNLVSCYPIKRGNIEIHLLSVYHHYFITYLFCLMENI